MKKDDIEREDENVPMEKSTDAPAKKDRAMPAKKDKNVFVIKRSYLYLIVIAAVFFAGGLLVSPLVQKPTITSQIIQSTSNSSSNTLSQNGGIGATYQEILNQVSLLTENVKSCDSQLVTEVQRLATEIENLRVLNPYYQFKEIKSSTLPSGTPGYGAELGVSYDNAADGVNVLARLEQSIGLDGLTEEEKTRYIKIGTTQGTACEYCCGLKTSFARSDGQRACGCAHNIAFSGLTMWMIQNGYTDEQILEEIQKWKALFFPKQTISKVIQAKIEAGEQGIEDMLKEFPDFLPQMVGGC